MRNGYPLVELHRHLEGNVRLPTVLDLARRHGVELPAWTEEELKPHVRIATRVASLVDFIAKFAVLKKVIADYDAVRRIVRENLEDAAGEGIDYIELRFSPWFMGEEHGLDPHGVVEAACDALEEARGKIPVQAKLIGIIARNYGPEIGRIELAAAIRGRDRGVVALDLAGDEAGYPGDLFVRHFAEAREAGLHTLAHAGEAAGAASVRQAVLGLGAERIGHGIRCLEDPAVVDLLRRAAHCLGGLPHEQPPHQHGPRLRVPPAAGAAAAGSGGHPQLGRPGHQRHRPRPRIPSGRRGDRSRRGRSAPDAGDRPGRRLPDFRRTGGDPDRVRVYCPAR